MAEGVQAIGMLVLAVIYAVGALWVAYQCLRILLRTLRTKDDR